MYYIPKTYRNHEKRCKLSLGDIFTSHISSILALGTFTCLKLGDLSWKYPHFKGSEGILWDLSQNILMSRRLRSSNFLQWLLESSCRRSPILTSIDWVGVKICPFFKKVAFKVRKYLKISTFDFSIMRKKFPIIFWALVKRAGGSFQCIYSTITPFNEKIFFESPFFIPHKKISPL